MKRLPDFLIIGAQKCGTSAAMRLLQKHPQIAGIRPPDDPAWSLENAPQHREPHFFDRHWQRGVDWYQGLFEDGDVIGEKTPSYIADPIAMHRIARIVPEVKLVVLLRHPVARLYSHYGMKCRRDCHESLSFDDWIRTAEGADAFWRGVYWKQLETVFALFPAEQIHMAFQEDMKADNITVMNGIQRFLGVDPINVAEKPRVKSAPPMSSEIQSMLDAWYHPHVNRLYEMLPVPQVDAWRRTAVPEPAPNNRRIDTPRSLLAKLHSRLRRQFAFAAPRLP